MSNPTSNEDRIRHLKWAVGSRARNQQCAVQLLQLFIEYEDQWKTKKWARAAQDLLSVSFSLWRAAFLADKTSKRADVFLHAKNFLEKLIEDNAISYVQDRTCKEWTFNYYTKNAKASLKALAESWPEQVEAYEDKTRTPIQRWEYCQDLLQKAVEKFRIAARDLAAQKVAATKSKETGLSASEKKRKSRAITRTARRSKKG